MNAKELKEVLQYDPCTGIFTRLKSAGGEAAGSVAGSHHCEGYISIGVCSERHLAHRLAWLYMTGAWPVGDIDHKDWIKTNNKFSNLREATRSQNMQNRTKAGSRSKSGLLGVSSFRDGKRWVAHIRANGRNRYLGIFATAQEAHTAYFLAKSQLHTFAPEVCK